MLSMSIYLSLFNASDPLSCMLQLFTVVHQRHPTRNPARINGAHLEVVKYNLDIIQYG